MNKTILKKLRAAIHLLRYYHIISEEEKNEFMQDAKEAAEGI